MRGAVTVVARPGVPMTLPAAIEISASDTTGPFTRQPGPMVIGPGRTAHYAAGAEYQAMPGLEVAVLFARRADVERAVSYQMGVDAGRGKEFHVTRARHRMFVQMARRGRYRPGNRCRTLHTESTRHRRVGREAHHCGI